MKANVHIYSVGYNINSQPYLSKLAKVLSCYTDKITFHCWRRKNTPSSSEHKGVKTRVLLNYGNDGSKYVALVYPIWMFLVFIDCLFKRKSGDVVICSKFESGFPVALLCHFKKIKFIYLDRDNLAFSYRGHPIVKSIALKLESFVARQAILHLVPGENRVYEQRDNIRVIHNTPHSETLAEAEKKINKWQHLRSDNKLNVYINGWMSERRGIDFILNTIEKCENMKLPIHFIVAGSGDDRVINRLELFKSVSYIGCVSNADALAIYYVMDLLLSFYDPVYEIHQRAEPNKWYDALFTSTNVIVNNDIKASEIFIDNYGFTGVKYGDVLGLINCFMDYQKDKDESKMTSYDDFICWDKRVHSVLKDIL
ncbi:hypothetical protein C942_03441 [Photobacterium marinum]|uniref:Glycosyltransferase n=1 Tax=Photobacterium marinum TaxID=1056511 RepID=L8J8L2_9GAMM|nr:hypothetical protein [Photobacterium marinum]ELR63772.1 hypothetical protein C942_03441 [Photobacterium marinum]